MSDNSLSEELDSGDDLVPQEEVMDQIDINKRNKKTKPQDLTFIAGHPQHKKHYITLVKEGFGLVPNFISGSLPRRDEGNREYYCATMMTLFKPWRTGQDLKSLGQSWDDAFHVHNFTPHHTQVMSKLNIQYECYDARDDYSKQRELGNIPGLPNMLDNMSMEKGNNFNDQGEYTMPYENDIQHEGAAEYGNTGKRSGKRLQQMDEIEKILDGSGWLDKCPSQIELEIPMESNDIEHKTKQQWTELIQKKTSYTRRKG
ncbi:hypothetical protein GLOTRDRAFT_96476 [Gloeophyllum trabeum ATCC 11539]|uniref:Uncharacterized protein n=1 Tax=Gloeophyllum trabeum (strain ATCC 11539 / FP-39264 / Madison 617) TaxID=670483 RepID=S7PV58_GLOTA|nr:uncharacterized protein GLOTRDRAFT_96476 [Gloeophyllum trabeum ATCC 11539]EPQ51297.1 hypothetical protein GLOTRDRAFT_96476 [Gloeophyllum trabeum ATCC 11539]